MKIIIQSIHFNATGMLQEIITKKLNKLVKIYQRINHAEVYLRLENNDKQDNKRVELRLYIPGYELFALAQAGKFEIAFDKANKSIRRQLKKHKEKDYAHAVVTPLKE